MNLVLGHHGSQTVALWDSIASNISPSSRHTMGLYARRPYLLIFTHGWLLAAVLFFYISAALFVLLLTSIN